MLKRCSICKIEKEFKEFNKNITKKNGLNNACRLCANAANKKWADANKEYRSAYDRQYYEDNKEEILQYKKEYNEEHKEERVAYDKQYYEENRETRLKQSKQWSKNNPDKWKERNQNRRAREVGNGGAHTAQEWINLKEKYNHTCLSCRRQEPEIKLTEDHVLPLIKGGTNFIDNIQPLCLSCNCSKQDKTIDYRK